jgi:hypothetical protein
LLNAEAGETAQEIMRMGMLKSPSPSGRGAG